MAINSVGSQWLEEGKRMVNSEFLFLKDRKGSQ